MQNPNGQNCRFTATHCTFTTTEQLIKIGDVRHMYFFRNFLVLKQSKEKSEGAVRKRRWNTAKMKKKDRKIENKKQKKYKQQKIRNRKIENKNRKQKKQKIENQEKQKIKKLKNGQQKKQKIEKQENKKQEKNRKIKN